MSKQQKQHRQIVPGHSLAVNVIGTEREDLNHALKAWKRQVKNSGVLEATKDRKEFEKPTVKRRKEKQAAVFMQYVRNLHAN